MGCTQRARLLGNVQGVVVQAITLVKGSSSSGKLTMTVLCVWGGERGGGGGGGGEGEGNEPGNEPRASRCRTCRVLDLLVVLAGLEVGEGSVAGGGVRHHLGNHVVR